MVDILVPANPGSARKWPQNEVLSCTGSSNQNGTNKRRKTHKK